MMARQPSVPNLIPLGISFRSGLVPSPSRRGISEGPYPVRRRLSYSDSGDLFETGFFAQDFGLVGNFPRKVALVPTKVTIGCRLPVARSAKPEVADDRARAEI